MKISTKDFIYWICAVIFVSSYCRAETVEEVLGRIDHWQAAHPGIAFKIRTIDNSGGSTEQIFWFRAKDIQPRPELRTRLEHGGTFVEYYSYCTEKGDYVSYFPVLGETVLCFGHSRLSALNSRLSTQRTSGEKTYKSATLEETPEGFEVRMDFDWNTLVGSVAPPTQTNGETYIPKTVRFEWTCKRDGQLLQVRSLASDFNEVSKITYLTMDTQQADAIYKTYFGELKKSEERNKKLSFPDALRLATREISEKGQ